MNPQLNLCSCGGEPELKIMDIECNFCVTCKECGASTLIYPDNYPYMSSARQAIFAWNLMAQYGGVPLSLEQLSTMSGKWVFIATLEKRFETIYQHGKTIPLETCGKTWLAYCHELSEATQ